MADPDAQTIRDEHREIMGLREEVRKDIALAIANFKVWLLVTVLSNVVLVGAPAFYVFIGTSSVAETAFSTSTANSNRLDRHRVLDLEQDARIADMEKFMADKYGYKRREPSEATEY